MYSKRLLFSCIVIFLTSCGGNNTQISHSANSNESIVIKNAEIKVLMMGNSHTSPIPTLLTTIFNQANPDLRVQITQAPGGMFLIDRMTDQRNLDLINKGSWTHVVLQGLKYSTTGTREYSTKGAETLIDLIRAVGSVPILYPEHPRRGNSWESNFLYQLHSGIASQYPACVSPIGFVWDDFMNKSDLGLHQQDGNHATEAGSFLTALVIYHTIMSRENFQNLPLINGVGISQDQQVIMRASVIDILSSYHPCRFLKNL